METVLGSLECPDSDKVLSGASALNTENSTHWHRLRPELMIVLLLAGVTVALAQLGIRSVSVLTMYFWPVVLAGYYYGRGRAMATAILASAVVSWLALSVPGAFTPPGGREAQVWIDIGVWSLLLVLTATVIGHLYEVKQRAYGQLRGAYNGVLELLSKFIDTADRYTEAHSVRVSLYATEVARRLGFSDAEIEDIRVAGLLHDVGKLEVGSDLLQKVGALTAAEWEMVRRHPANGAWLVGRVGGMMRNAIPFILYHHEWFDGGGYYRLRHREIPLGARIIAVVDAFDAMTTDRSYRSGRSTEDALTLIEDNAGKQFDPQVAAVFVEAMRDPRSGLSSVRERASRFEGLAWPDRELEGMVAVAGGSSRPRLL